MPELPEVETAKRGLDPIFTGCKVVDVSINVNKLRWEIPPHIVNTISGFVLNNIKRRGKYLLFNFDSGTLIIHLGMSGSIRVGDVSSERVKHDHFEIYFDNGKVMRLNDPRKFGCVLFTVDGKHKLLDHLGPEPLEDEFTSQHLFMKSIKKNQNVKAFIMDSKVVVGVGNIYACESLFVSGINPETPAKEVSENSYLLLTDTIKNILAKSIEVGGTTLNDFSDINGNPGYFAQTLMVYGREGLPCVNCSGSIKRIVQNQRSTFFCPTCQK